jgi:tetraacyldisaccharide-1-P 4'-kinase
MTEKDAVKCSRFAGSNWWAVELDVAPECGFIEWLAARLKQQQDQGRRANDEGMGNAEF